MMIYLFPEQLQEKLAKKFDYYYYILFGNDLFLLEDTKNYILKYIRSFYSYECYNFLLNNKLSWDEIFTIYQTKNLFNHKKKFFYLL